MRNEPEMTKIDMLPDSNCTNTINSYSLNLSVKALRYGISFFTHLKLCLVTATHKFKWVKNNILLCRFSAQPFNRQSIQFEFSLT